METPGLWKRSVLLLLMRGGKRREVSVDGKMKEERYEPTMDL